MYIQIHALTLCLWWLATCLVVATPMNPPPQGNNWAHDPSRQSSVPSSHVESTSTSPFGQQLSSSWSQQPPFHNPAASQPSLDHYHHFPNERPLDQEDQRILDSLLADLTQNHPGVLPDDGHERFVDSLIVDPHPDQLMSPGVAASSSPPSAFPSLASARDPVFDRANNGGIGQRLRPVFHWEPKSFSRFPPVRPFADFGRKNHLFHGYDELLHDRINSIVFAGKLRWAQPQELAGLSGHNYRNRWPVKQTSRQLPFVHALGHDNSQIPIYMTHHYSSRYTSNLLDKGIADSVLEGRPHYFFWGVHDTGNAILVIGYGAGRIERADYSAVDSHLAPLLDFAERRAFPHA